MVNCYQSTVIIINNCDTVSTKHFIIVKDLRCYFPAQVHHQDEEEEEEERTAARVFDTHCQDTVGQGYRCCALSKSSLTGDLETEI